MSNIGFIGLGIMGKPMAQNLLKAGHTLVVYDLVSGPVDELTAAGAARGASCADTASRSDVIVTMLPDGPEVEAAVLGPGGVLEGARAGSTVVDMSSISPIVSQKVGAACQAKGVGFLDAPVSGGEPKAIDATLAIMVGGKADVFEKVQADPAEDGFERDADRSDGGGQRHETGQPDYGGVQYRRHGRGAGAGHARGT